MRDVGNVIALAGLAVYFAAYVWAFVLASRVSSNWFIGMLFFDWLLYPVFAYKNWNIAKNNCIVIILGITLLAIGFVILWATNPYKNL